MTTDVLAPLPNTGYTAGPGACDSCGRQRDERRPYNLNGATICRTCDETPADEVAIKRRMNEINAATRAGGGAWVWPDDLSDLEREVAAMTRDWRIPHLDRVPRRIVDGDHREVASIGADRLTDARGIVALRNAAPSLIARVRAAEAALAAIAELHEVQPDPGDHEEAIALVRRSVEYWRGEINRCVEHNDEAGNALRAKDALVAELRVGLNRAAEFFEIAAKEEQASLPEQVLYSRFAADLRALAAKEPG